MAYAHGFRWTDERIAYFQKLRLDGLTVIQISRAMTEHFGETVSFPAISNVVTRFKSTNYLVNSPERDQLIPTYQAPQLSDDNYIISCDYHGPYYSIPWFNRLLAVAEKFKIKRHVIVGDLFDFDFIKHFYSEHQSSLEREMTGMTSMIEALGYFDINYLIQGNHERRIGIQTNGHLRADDIFGKFGDAWTKKFQYTKYDRMFIGDKWLVVHPKSYSQISASVAVRLAEKFHRHVLNAHGHFTALRFDRSGKYMAIDLGGLFDVSRIDYCNERTTSHPEWNPGFGMIFDGHFYHFHEGTDFNYWLKK